jgi:hypothetical protein
MGMHYGDLVSMIRGAGKQPVERNSLYESVRENFDEQLAGELVAGAGAPAVHAA